jgi:hypothetical protein
VMPKRGASNQELALPSVESQMLAMLVSCVAERTRAGMNIKLSRKRKAIRPKLVGNGNEMDDMCAKVEYKD